MESITQQNGERISLTVSFIPNKFNPALTLAMVFELILVHDHIRGVAALQDHSPDEFSNDAIRRFTHYV